MRWGGGGLPLLPLFNNAAVCFLDVMLYFLCLSLSPSLCGAQMSNTPRPTELSGDLKNGT